MSFKRVLEKRRIDGSKNSRDYVCALSGLAYAED